MKKKSESNLYKISIFLMAILLSEASMAKLSCDDLLSGKMVYDVKSHYQITEFFGRNNELLVFNPNAGQADYTELFYKKGEQIRTSRVEIANPTYFILQLQSGYRGQNLIQLSQFNFSRNNPKLFSLSSGGEIGSQSISVYVDQFVFRLIFSEPFVNQITGEVREDKFEFEFAKNSDGTFNTKFNFIRYNDQNASIFDALQEVRTFKLSFETNPQILKQVVPLFIGEITDKMH